jgi:hypothetical protein
MRDYGKVQVETREVRLMGRPSSYTPEVATTICERLAAGETLRSICRTDPAFPAESTIRQWVTDDRDGFAERYLRARDAGLDAVADEIVEISDDARNDWMEREDPENPGYALNGEHISRSRLRVDSRKWYLSKMAPKRYGDQLRLQGDPDAPLVFEHRLEPGAMEQTIAEILTRALERRAHCLRAGFDLDRTSRAIGRFTELQAAVQVIEGVIVATEGEEALALVRPAASAAGDFSDLA